MGSIITGNRRQPGRNTSQGSGRPATIRGNQREVPVRLPYYVTLLISMPMPGHGFNDPEPSDIGLMAAFKQIRKQFEVELSIKEDEEVVELKATSRQKANEAARALRRILARKPGDRAIWRPLVLVKPPQGDKENLRVILVPMEGVHGARPTAIANVGTATPPDEAAAVYRGEFDKALFRTLENLRYVPNRMRMRVNFGNFLLKEWKKDKSEYTFSELKDAAGRAGHRGTARLFTHIGNSTTVKRIRDQVPSLFPGSVPREIRADDAADIKPTLSLVLLTKNLCVESVIETVSGKTAVGSVDKPKSRYTLGPPTVFHREKRDRAVTIMTSCPQDSYDWSLEVENQINDTDTTTPVPFTELTLNERIQLGESKATGDFLSVNLPLSFARAHDVDSVIGKTSWSYMINHHYVLEISLFHQWGEDTRAAPASGAVISMYGYNWDYDLDCADISTGPREWTDFADKFFKVGSETNDHTPDACDDFLSRIYRVQDMLTTVTGGEP